MESSVSTGGPAIWVRIPNSPSSTWWALQPLGIRALQCPTSMACLTHLIPAEGNTISCKSMLKRHRFWVCSIVFVDSSQAGCNRWCGYLSSWLWFALCSCRKPDPGGGSVCCAQKDPGEKGTMTTLSLFTLVQEKRAPCNSGYEILFCSHHF